MRRALLRQAIGTLPRALREDISGYATFVREVAGHRAAEMKMNLSRDQTDQVVFLAAIVCLRDVVVGQLALVDAATGNRGAAADANVRGLRLTGEDLHPGSP